MSEPNSGPMDEPAFPLDAGQDYHPDMDRFIQRGFQPGITLRQYAAINLKVPNSGIPELDDMIRESLRDQLSGQALAAWSADMAYESADKAMLARKAGAR